MEYPPHQGGNLQDTQTQPIPPPGQTPPQLPQDQESPESPDEQVIHQGIEQARLDNTDIDNHTARYIAAQLHEGQTSALYSLASTGAIPETLADELIRNFDHQPAHVQNWITWLSMYCLNRQDKGPVSTWAASAAVIDQADRAEPEARTRVEEDEQARVDLLQRISAAGVTTLGHIATITTVSDTEHTTPGHIPTNTQDNLTTERTTESQTTDSHHQDDHDGTNQDNEPDVFPWHDAAHSSPTSRDDELAHNRLDLLFAEIPDQELGTTQHMGWFGLLKREDRPGGVVLSQNTYGFRHVRETDSDEELAEHWDQLQREYDAFNTATQAHRRESAHRTAESTDQPQLNERTNTESTHYPKLWVGSLSDYNDGHLHGTWLDATLDPDDLHLAIQFILRTGHDSTTEEWAIMDYDDFCGLNLGEYESLKVISRIANGIAEHGEAFAKWVSYVGERSEELLTDERFQDHYLGYFESTEAYAEYFLEETGSYEFMDYVPDSLRPYVKIDTELMGRDMEIELYVAEAHDGGVFVFDGQG